LKITQNHHKTNYLKALFIQKLQRGKCSPPKGLNIKGVVHLKKKKKLLLIIYSPPCHPRCPCLSFFIQKEIKVFDENIPGFFSI